MLAALIGRAAAHHYALGAKQGSCCGTVKSVSSLQLYGQNRPGQGLDHPFADFRLAQDKFSGLQVCSVVHPEGCGMLHEGHYSSILLYGFSVSLSQEQKQDCF